MDRDEIIKQFLLHAAATAKDEKELDAMIEKVFRVATEAALDSNKKGHDEAIKLLTFMNEVGISVENDVKRMIHSLLGDDASCDIRCVMDKLKEQGLITHEEHLSIYQKLATKKDGGC